MSFPKTTECEWCLLDAYLLTKVNVNGKFYLVCNKCKSALNNKKINAG